MGILSIEHTLRLRRVGWPVTLRQKNSRWRAKKLYSLFPLKVKAHSKDVEVGPFVKRSHEPCMNIRKLDRRGFT